MAHHVYLIIKGDKHAAALAAANHNIPLAFDRETNHGTETVGRTSDEHHDAVVKWFHEPPNSAPYPVGALLSFSRISEDK